MNLSQPPQRKPLPPVKYLLVDDREDNLLVLAALLRRDDVEILSARSGIEALELLLQHEVALAFLDVQMPEMDGFELAELIRGSERTRHVPLIFVTAGAHDHHRMFKGYESGAVDFLHKPVEPHILRNKAEVFFQLYRQRQLLALELDERTQALRFNEMFVAVLGHDLRTPLSSIMMSASALPKLAPSAAIEDVSALMLRSTSRMSRMIDDMLDLARARLGGGILISPATADLGVLVARVVEEHQANNPDPLVQMHQQGDLCGRWDADRLGQVVTNLLGNALRHGQPGGSIEIHLDGRLERTVRLSICNAGVIAPELLPHIFDPFRSRQNGGRSHGLGLGLYIVQQIVHAHGGRVHVHPREDAQTEFRMEIPRLAVS